MKKIIMLFLPFLLLFSFSCTKKPIKVACVGNSITEGPGREHPESYPLQLQSILGKAYEVVNFGVSGRTLLQKGDFPYWNEPQFEEVKAFEPDILIIKLGTNDSKPQNWEFKEDFKIDFLKLIRSFKTNMPQSGKVFICLPVPVTEDNYGIREHILVDEMRPILYEIASEAEATIIDLYSPLYGRTDLLPDGVHPNAEGLGLMAKEVARAIQ
jgi:acyl-CoA thioesterase-1